MGNLGRVHPPIRNVGKAATEQVTSGSVSTDDKGASEAGEGTIVDSVSPSV